MTATEPRHRQAGVAGGSETLRTRRGWIPMKDDRDTLTEFRTAAADGVTPTDFVMNTGIH